MKALMTNLQRILALFVVTCLVTGCQGLQPKKNIVVLFLEGAELQIETQGQLQELEHALQDMLRLPPKQLRERRYSDYQMNEGVWTLTQILSAYFLPQRPLSIDFERFYADAATDAARSIVKKKLVNLQSLEFD